jgi:hypothetical protein
MLGAVSLRLGQEKFDGAIAAEDFELVKLVLTTAATKETT